MLDKQRIVYERFKSMKLYPALLEWAPQLTCSAVEVEESKVEIEVFNFYYSVSIIEKY